MTDTAAAQRIHIVGGPGAGKTTLAAALGRRLGVAAFDLDDLAQGVAPDFRPARSLALREFDIRRLSDSPGWVTEGSYLWWTDELFERAQVIVWLDAPWAVAVRRIVLRYLRSYASDVIRASGVRARLRALRFPHARHLVSFMRWSSHYYAARTSDGANARDPDDMYALTRAATAAYLERYASKVVRVRRGDAREVGAVLARSTPAPALRTRSQSKTLTGGVR